MARSTSTSTITTCPRRQGACRRYNRGATYGEYRQGGLGEERSMAEDQVDHLAMAEEAVRLNTLAVRQSEGGRRGTAGPGPDRGRGSREAVSRTRPGLSCDVRPRR